MSTRAFRLAMRAPLHIGEAGIGLEESLPFVPSDTIFSALVITWLEMGERDAVNELETIFADTPAFFLSSTMPYVGDIRLLPRPMLMTPMEGSTLKADELNDDAPPTVKKLRRVRWVSEAIFAQLIDSISPSALYELWQNATAIQDGAVWVTQEECQQIRERLVVPTRLHDEEITIWSISQSPKVSIDRINNRSNLYHVGSVRFAPHCGLWVIVQGDAAWLTRIESALQLLADSGIGGRRSRGNGVFDLHQEDAWQQLPEAEGDYWLLLGRLAPTVDQMDLLRRPGSSYHLVRIGGWNGTPGDAPFVRRKVRMLSEGSIIGKSDRPPGSLVDLKPTTGVQIDHPVLRYGYGLSLNVNIPTEHLNREVVA